MMATESIGREVLASICPHVLGHSYNTSRVEETQAAKQQ